MLMVEQDLISFLHALWEKIKIKSKTVATLLNVLDSGNKSIKTFRRREKPQDKDHASAKLPKNMRSDSCLSYKSS